MRRAATLLLALVVCIAGAVGIARAETTPALVLGADLLYVRRGPGTKFPAFATIEKGERVEVERLDGVWALVRLTSGQEGYVHSMFLSFPGQPRATMMVIATPSRQPTPSPTPTAIDPAAELKLRNSELEAEVRSLRTRLDALGPPAEARPTAASTGQDNTLEGEIRRLANEVEALRSHLEGEDAGSRPEGSLAGERSWSASTIGLFMLMAVLIGWVAGSVYGRQSERSRRSRIRF